MDYKRKSLGCPKSVMSGGNDVRDWSGQFHTADLDPGRPRGCIPASSRLSHHQQTQPPSAPLGYLLGRCRIRLIASYRHKNGELRAEK